MTVKKLAIFVEGQTELIFVERLITEVIGCKNIHIERCNARDNLTKIKTKEHNECTYYVLIYDCQNDERVKTEILDKRDSLIKNGFSSIIGLRDVHPIEPENIMKLKRGLATGVPTKGISIAIFIAKMEVEAWFIQEATHYQKINDQLTNQFISSNTGFNPLTDNAEDQLRPAPLLHEIYSLVGLAYKKKLNQTNRTVNALDYEELYINLPTKLPSLKAFVERLDSFFT